MASHLPSGRRIGIDYGDVRVGLAICDMDAILVSPLETVQNDQQLFANLLRIIKEQEVLYIALGSPKHLSGAESSKSQSIMNFGKKLSDLTGLDIYLIDERFTTKTAIGQLHDAGRDTKNSRAIIDQLAAVNILNQALVLESSEVGLGEPL